MSRCQCSSAHVLSMDSCQHSAQPGARLNMGWRCQTALLPCHFPRTTAPSPCQSPLHRFHLFNAAQHATEQCMCARVALCRAEHSLCSLESPAQVMQQILPQRVPPRNGHFTGLRAPGTRCGLVRCRRSDLLHPVCLHGHHDRLRVLQVCWRSTFFYRTP